MTTKDEDTKSWGFLREEKALTWYKHCKRNDEKFNKSHFVTYTLTNMTFRNFLERSWIKWKELAWKPEDSDYCNIICFTVATRHLDIKPSDLHEEDSHNRLAHTLYLVCTQRIFTKGVSRIFCSTKQKFCHGEKTEARIKSSGCFFIFFPSSSRSKMVSYLPLMKFWCQKWSVIFLSYTAWWYYRSFF